MEIFQDHLKLEEDVKKILYPWMKLTIGVDGKDGAKLWEIRILKGL
jgi:hypothetical protein